MKKRSFFTLVELMAAMAILALLGTAAAAALTGFQRSHDKVTVLSERLERNRKLDKVAELMGNIIPFFWIDETDDDYENLVFDGQEEELFFTAMRLPDGRGQGAFIFVRLFVDDNKRFVCEYKNTPMLPWLEDEDQQLNIKKEILAEKVESVAFFYADYTDDDEIELLEYWDQDDEEYENTLPVGVGFTIVFESGEKLSYFRRTAGVSAYSGLAL
ncbi:MAG: prepilin-type N-terminal cleavage/methylation domain-containing protein [Lentisphaerae bacterium]|nr:prepilin-type N-terminal cleavage/methylation domain-containing protein [Lentisphaerota bacterium]